MYMFNIYSSLVIGWIAHIFGKDILGTKHYMHVFNIVHTNAELHVVHSLTLHCRIQVHNLLLGSLAVMNENTDFNES